METHTADRILTFERVRNAIAASINLAPTEITSAMKLRDLADSLEIAQLVLDLEDDLSVEIGDDDLARLFTVQDVVDYLNGHS